MKRVSESTILASVLVLCSAEQSEAGSYSDTVDCTSIVGGFCAQGLDRDLNPIGAFAITHPPGYTGISQPVVSVDVCVSQLAPYHDLTNVTLNALSLWSAMTPILGNCEPFCSLPEDPNPEAGFFDAASVVLHEIGHVLGLDHPNLRFEDPAVEGTFVHSSFSAAYDGAPAGVLIGSDGVRGSRDDFMDDLFGTTAVNVNWFRELDNDPFAIDSEVIDIDHYSRATNTQLPAGSDWAANANFCYGFQAGHARTHSVMYSTITNLMAYSGLAADDVNAMKMQRAGEDRLAATGDDYSLVLNFVTECQDAEIEVTWGPDLSSSTLGSTASRVVPTFAAPPPPLARHYTIVPPSGISHVYVFLNPDKPWNFLILFADGFEGGDFARWTEVLSGFDEDAASGVPGHGPGDPHPYSCPVAAPAIPGPD